jgi:ABC-2 type transport system permease protein
MSRTLRAVVAQARLETTLLVRSSESLLVTLGVPLGVLVFFSVVPVLPTGDVDAVTFLVPGVLALSAMATGLVASAIQTAYERKSGALKLLGATPLGRGGFVAAKLASVVAILLVQTGLVMGLALALLGWRPDGGVLGVLVAVPGVVLIGLVMASLGLLIAGTLTAELTTAVTNALFLGLLLLGGVAVSPDVLPTAMAALGAASPLGAGVGVLRATLDATPLPLGSLAALVAWGGIGALVAGRRFRWEA